MAGIYMGKTSKFNLAVQMHKLLLTRDQMFSTREVITHPSNLQCLPSKYAHQDQYLSHLIVGPVKPSMLTTIFITTINTADITRTNIVIFS